MLVAVYLDHAAPWRAIHAALRELGHRPTGRTAHLWAGEVEPVGGIYAPHHPEIREAYLAAGIPHIDIPDQRPQALTQRPQHDRIIIACPGPSLPDTWASWRPGLANVPVIAVNLAASLVPADYWIASDGWRVLDRFGKPPIGTPIKLTTGRTAATAVGPVHDVHDLVTLSGWTLAAAIQVAAGFGAREILIMGDDRVVAPGADGIGVEEGNRGANRWRSMSKVVDPLIGRLREGGVAVQHLAPDAWHQADNVQVAHGVPPAAADDAGALTIDAMDLPTRTANELRRHGVTTCHRFLTVAADARGRDELIALWGINQTNLPHLVARAEAALAAEDS